MLMRFNVGNFLSFNDIQEFSMISCNDQSKAHYLPNTGEVNLLKFSAVLGANASGKSNLIRAITFARDIILKGLEINYTGSYFRLNERNADKPSYFEFELLVKGKYYSYGFEIQLSKNELISEWLYEISSSGDTVIFERDFAKGKYGTGVAINQPDIKSRFDVYFEDLKANSGVLFLNEMNRNKSRLYFETSPLSPIQDVYCWFKQCLSINYPDMVISRESYFYYHMEPERIGHMIKAFDTGITDLEIVESSFEEAVANLPKSLTAELETEINKMIIGRKSGNIADSDGITLRSDSGIYLITINDRYNPEVKTIVFKHGRNGVVFKFSEESEGTRRIFSFMEILAGSKEPKVFVIDEIDRSLHPQLIYRFIEIFLELKNINCQLIVTTHESRLLDFNLLKREEIWFVEKNEKGESIIYSLEAFSERFDNILDKAYLDGRYGGVPNFSPFFPDDNNKGRY